MKRAVSNKLQTDNSIGLLLICDINFYQETSPHFTK